MFVRLLDDYGLRSLYREGMVGTHVRAYQLNALLAEALPALHRHLADAGVQPLMYAAQWFMTLFATDLPLPTVLRIVDVLLVEGADVTLRFALALLRANQDALLRLPFEGLLEHLRHHMYTETAFRDASELVAEALRVRLSDRRLQRWEQEARAQLESTNREKTELVQARADRRDAEARAKSLETKLAAAEAENDRLAQALVEAKLSQASALTRIDDLVGSLVGGAGASCSTGTLTQGGMVVVGPGCAAGTAADGGRCWGRACGRGGPPHAAGAGARAAEPRLGDRASGLQGTCPYAFVFLACGWLYVCACVPVRLGSLSLALSVGRPPLPDDGCPSCGMLMHIRGWRRHCIPSSWRDGD